MWTNRVFSRSQSAAGKLPRFHHGSIDNNNIVASIRKSKTIRSISIGSITTFGDGGAGNDQHYYEHETQQQQHRQKRHHPQPRQRGSSHLRLIQSRSYHSHRLPTYHRDNRILLPRPKVRDPLDVYDNITSISFPDEDDEQNNRQNPSMETRVVGDDGEDEPMGIDYYDGEPLDCSQYEEVPPPPKIPRDKNKLKVKDHDEDDNDEEDYDSDDDDDDDEWNHGIDVDAYPNIDDPIHPEPELVQPNNNNNTPKKAPMYRITTHEASSILNRACSLKRGIKLNKRQRIKAWIPALLLHRYDRGIRDRDELNCDNVYYHRQLRNDNWGIGGGGYVHNPHDIEANNPIKEYIDIRKVLKPAEHEVHAFIHSIHNDPNANDDDRRLFNFTKKARKRAKAFLIKEKSACLAYEARGVLADRNVPFVAMSGLESEEEARYLAESDPSIFLSHFSRVMALVEVEIHERGGDGIMDFKHRRNYPPELDDDGRRQQRQQQRQQRGVVEEVVEAGVGATTGARGPGGRERIQKKKKKKGKGGHPKGQHPYRTNYSAS